MNAFVHARALATIVVIAVAPAAGDTARSIEPAPRVCHLPLEALEAMTAPRCLTERAEPARG